MESKEEILEKNINLRETNSRNAGDVDLDENEELKERFIGIFSLYNKKYNMPVEIAWNKFKKIVERRSISIDSSDTEKIVSLCTEVKRDYYENDRGMIVDSNGEPNIEANEERNENFLRENPDIKRAVEVTLSNEKFQEILQEKTLHSFMEKFLALNESETEEFINAFFENNINMDNNEELKKDDERLSKKTRNGEELSSEEKEKAIEIEKNRILYNIFKTRQEEERDEFTPEEEKMILMISARYLMSDDEESLKKAAMILTGIMPKEEINLLSTNLGECIDRWLGRLNSKVVGSYENIVEVIEATDEMLFQQYKARSEEIQQIQNEQIYEIMKDAQNIEFQATSIKENLNTKLEEDTYNQFKNIDFSKDQNKVILLKMYIDLDKMIKNENTIYLNQENGRERAEATKNVLEQIIFSPKNAGIFGDYLDFIDGNTTLNAEKVESDSKKFDEEYKIVFNTINVYIKESKKDDRNDNKKDNENDNENNVVKKIDKAFEKAEERRLSKIDKKELLNTYINKKDEYEKSKDSYQRMKLKAEILEIERDMSKIKDFFLFFVEGKVDLEDVKQYYEFAYNSGDEHGVDSELHDIIVEFCNLEKETSTEKQLKMDDLKRKVFSEKIGDGNYELYNELYTAYMSDFCEKNAIETIYSAYLNGKSIENMERIPTIRYIEALGYLYMAEEPQMVSFAENMIRLNFPNIKLSEDGHIDKDDFRKIYDSYHTGVGNKTLENAKQIYERPFKQKISKSKKFDYSKSGMKYDLTKINEALENSLEERSVSSILYSDEEQQIIDKIKKSANFENPKDIGTIVLIIKSLDEKGENLSDEERTLLNTINKFVTSAENRAYFGEYINVDRIVTSNVSTPINPKIIDAIGYNGEIKTKYNSCSIEQTKFENDKLEDITTILECVFAYGNDIEKLENKMRQMGVLEHECTALFRKEGNIKGELDDEKISYLISEINKIEHSITDRRDLSKILTKSLSNGQYMEAFIEDFDAFVEGAYLTMQTIVNIDKSFSDEEIQEAYEKRKEKSRMMEGNGWDEVQEALRKMEERNPSLREVDFDGPGIDLNEREARIDAIENSKLIEDEEFQSVIENEESALTWEELKIILKTMEERNPSSRFKNIEGISDTEIETIIDKKGIEISVDETKRDDKIEKSSMPELENIELQTENINENSEVQNPINSAIEPAQNIVAEEIHIETDEPKMGVLGMIKARIKNALNRTKALPNPDEKEEKKSLIDTLKEFFTKKKSEQEDSKNIGNSQSSQESLTFDQRYSYRNNDVEARALEAQVINQQVAQQGLPQRSENHNPSEGPDIQ